MKAIEAYYRILGGVMVGRYIPIRVKRFKEEFFTACFGSMYVDDGDGLSIYLEEYPITYGYAYNQRDADDYDEKEGEAEAFIECHITLGYGDTGCADDRILEISTYGCSDSYDDEGECIENATVAIDADAKELFDTIEHVVVCTLERLELYESDYHAEHDFDVDEDMEYERWKDHRDC